jgi:acetyl-CoA carboxylase biotin carboxylase subunit
MRVKLRFRFTPGIEWLIYGPVGDPSAHRRSLRDPIEARASVKRILIANRGEIALRAIRACRKLGHEAVAVHSTADRGAAHVWAADRAVCIGPPPAAQSYLNMPALIEAARGSGCDAVYPGYGFLSEKAAFAQACVEAGLTFVGPSAEAIAVMGDKAAARRTAKALGVPVVPGSEGGFTDPAAAADAAAAIGFPLLLKASAGGGGRGMRVVREPAAFEAAFHQATAEAEAAFGNCEIYLERFFDRVRHVEIQVFGDAHGNCQHLWERDCSVQRRHQKLVEEGPSPVLDEERRRAMADAALTIARGIGYTNAGTVEFIYDLDSRDFFFIEMNTRIQVEHPVTEMLTGVDLVAEQLRVAAGEALSFAAAPPTVSGHVIEWRINAEDGDQGFCPSPGRITRWRPPEGPGIRFDSHAFEGYTVSPFYDSMLGKLVVAGTDRDDAIKRSAAALARFEAEGIATTIPFHRRLLARTEFLRAELHTRWIDERLQGHA